MAENKKSFLLYCDQIESFECLEDDEAGRLIKHIFRYVNDKNPEAPDRITKISFEPIKNQLKRDLLKYEEIRVKRSLAGIKSAEQRQQVSTSVESVEQDITKPTVIDTVNDTVTDNVKVKDTVTESDKEKKEDNKDVSDLTKSVHPSYGFIKDSFLKFYKEKKGLDYYFKPIDGKKINSLIPQILFQVKIYYPEIEKEKEPEKINDAFKFTLEKMNDNFIIENLSLSLIDSKFNEIISKIKTPPTNGKQSVIANNEAVRKTVLTKHYDNLTKRHSEQQGEN